MTFTHIYTTENSQFADIVSEWANSLPIENTRVDLKEESILSEVEGLVLFHENSDFSKNHHEVLSFFENKQRAISKIDINGTLMVAVSNFGLWMERNKCKSILVVGSDDLLKNPNLERFLEKLKTV